MFAPNPTHERDEHLLSDVQDRRFQVPIATIHVLEGRYDERRIGHVSRAVQDALISVLKIPAGTERADRRARRHIA
jgi:hypothetical protein